MVKLGRKFTDFLKESSNFCSIPQSFSLKNVHYFKSHNLPIHFHASSKEKTFKKGHLLPIYGITYFSHFFRTFAKNCTFLSFFVKKVICEKMPRSNCAIVRGRVARIGWESPYPITIGKCGRVRDIKVLVHRFAVGTIVSRQNRM